MIGVTLQFLSPVSTGMGDCLGACMPPWYVTKPTWLTQPCIPPGSLYRVPAVIGQRKGGWQVTLYDSIWHVSSRTGEIVLLTAVCIYLYVYSVLCVDFLGEPFCGRMFLLSFYLVYSVLMIRSLVISQ